MFFPEKITNIKKEFNVLEVGPGGNPHPRADVLLEKKFNNESTANAQRGYVAAARTDQKIIFYDGEKFPFNDNQFDYVICSHVIEHVENIEAFINEIKRVAPRGYIEFPNVFYELINYQDVHLWFLTIKDGKILFLSKNKFESNNIHKAFREMFYCKDQYLQKSFNLYKEFFFCGFEWEKTISFDIVNSFDELVGDNDLVEINEYFERKGYISNIDVKKRNKMSFNKIKRIANFLIPKPKKIKAAIHKTAKLENKRLIKIGNFSEIKDYVIISTFSNEVVIGKYCQINPFTVIYGGFGVFIGDNVMIAPHCMIAAGDHDFKQIEQPIRFAGNISKGPIIIEDNVWIGANCTITDGVRIGKDAVVAANSVVTKDVEPFSIVGGVPAKFISSRLDSKKG